MVQKVSWRAVTFRGGVGAVDDLRLVLTHSSLEVTSPASFVTLEDAATFDVGHGCVVWVSPDARFVVVTSAYGDLLHIVRVPTGDVVEEPLVRGDDLRRRHVSATPHDDELIVLYERGLLVVSSDGHVRWHRLIDDFTAFIADATPRGVVLESQWPLERTGARVTFRLDNGEMLPQDIA